MSFREWLPITRRNRVALGLAGLALTMFVGWNCMPFYQFSYYSQPQWQYHGITATAVWPFVFELDPYMALSRNFTQRGFVEMIAKISVLFSGLIVTLAVPFWETVHATPSVRIPCAIANFLGGMIIFVMLMYDAPFIGPWGAPAYMTVSLSMLTISAALFTFKNELALRSERRFPQAGG